MALIQIGTTVGVLLGTLVSLSILSSVIGAVGGGTKEILVGETAILGAAAYYLHTSEIIGLPLAATIVLLPLFTQVFAYLWFMYVGKKVLSGEYGEEAQWAGELVEEGDSQFIDAVKQLDQMEIREIGIMAESKEELRERTVEEVSDE